MIAAAGVCAALIVALLAARATLRRRAVFLLGRQGLHTAPGVLASCWVAGLLLGQFTRSMVGMTWTAALALVAVAALARARSAPLRARHRVWTPIDLGIVFGMGLLFWFTERWDFECHRAIVGQFLHGNLPPTALNDPTAPLAYHAVFDALVAVVLTALPLDFGQGMAMVSTACVALTITNLRAVTRSLFRTAAAAQLGRVLFAFGYGPTFVRCFWEGLNTDALHGRTSQSYADAILRRPAGLGIAFYTLALALVLPVYRTGPGEPGLPQRRRAWTALAFLLPACALLPRMSEESVLFLGVVLAPLVLRGRLPWRLTAALAAAGLLGLAGSGVLLGLLGHGTMATPHPRLAWPPALPQWKFVEDGVPLWSGNGLLFFALELGPAFLVALGAALMSGQGRRRILAALFLAGLAVAAFVRPQGWPKSDMDRFLLYGTPPIFMLVAGLVDGVERRLAASPARRRALAAVAVGLAVAVAGAPAVYPAVVILDGARDTFGNHALGGELKRDLAMVGPRERILAPVQQANELLQAGFMVVAPLDTNSVGVITENHFDDYVRDHARDAAWLFLPEKDPRLAGKPAVARHAGFVLVRAAPATAAPAR